MAAIYDGLEFKTKLEAQWAAFFDLSGWTWRTNPQSVGNWKPDFRVEIPCGHSECNDSHSLLVAVIPASSMDECKGHPALKCIYGTADDGVTSIGADAGAVFGSEPEISLFQISHGAGGGMFTVAFFSEDPDGLWREAEKSVT